ncbi:class I SAM-dependent methyltransferase [Actinomadura barringtoniae]|uniref:Class I SAM-dependent methyltransferase n=2 Tax=Actinomadura barringtoniae TaxID=1427535 RepID=A0A939T6G6_9ACTN|nr:class I SAM-dependent methyltransferase [Actinomadura barringtoniae]
MGSRYESVVLDAIPRGCGRAVDVGCGNGGLTRELRRRGVPEVVGIDLSEACIERCRAHPDGAGIKYVVGDVLGGALEPGSFDLVSSMASLHHMDTRAGLVGLRDLVAPGGVLAVVGLARPDLPKDIPREVAAAIVSRVRPVPGMSEDMPRPPIVWPPPERYATVRRLAAEVLPGVRWRRHLRFRYSLVWTKPAP